MEKNYGLSAKLAGKVNNSNPDLSSKVGKN